MFITKPSLCSYKCDDYCTFVPKVSPPSFIPNVLRFREGQSASLETSRFDIGKFQSSFERISRRKVDGIRSETVYRVMECPSLKKLTKFIGVGESRCFSKTAILRVKFDAFAWNKF